MKNNEVVENSLSSILHEHLKNNNLKAARKLIRDEQYASSINKECCEIVAVVSEFLNENNFIENTDLYITCENLMKIVAEKCNKEEALFEFLEIIETTKNDEIFTSILKALQIVLLRLHDNKTRSLEWSLNSIASYISNIKVPDYLEKNIGKEEESILENDDTVRRLLQLYLTILLFLEPIQQHIAENVSVNVFRNNGMTRRNILASFILQLMGKPLSNFNLEHLEESKSKSYSRQCAESLLNHFSKMMGDPFYLLSYAENRIRWPKKTTNDSKNGVYENASHDIFMSDEKAPLLTIGVYYYLLLCENLLPDSAPKVYSNHYIFEKGLYLVVTMINNEENYVHYKGLRLGSALIERLGSKQLNCEDLELHVHVDFCKCLVKIIVYSTVNRDRKEGTLLLKKYIYKYDKKGRHLLLKSLFKTVEHNGLYAYLATLYKNMVADELESNENNICEWYTGKALATIMLKNICVLKKGAATDLMDHSDLIISALNILRYFLIRDKSNKLSIWDIVLEIEDNFLKPLRSAIDLSRAHYQNEHKSVTNEKDETTSGPDCTIEILGGGDVPHLTKRKKLNLIACALNNFDIMDSLLARVNECIDTRH